MHKRLSPDVLKKIRQIEICTRRLMNGALVGDARSAVKGSGFEFDQIREYQLGDDIRFIDWSGSARADKLLVRQYRQERDHTIMIAVDVSASSHFSSSVTLRAEIMAQIASILTLVADSGKDAVGLILFSDTVEHTIPAGRGRTHARKIMETLFDYTPQQAVTNIASALEYIAALKQRNVLVFLISDFIDMHTFEKPLRSVAKRHDLIALRCLDSFEYAVPAVGFVSVKDPETGVMGMLDMRSKKNNVLNAFLHERAIVQKKLFKKYGVDCLDITLNKPFVGDIIRFFRRRMMY